MANRYLISVASAWDASNTAIWAATSGGSSGASAPTSSDDVIIDSSSPGGTLTINSGAACNNLTVTWTSAGTNVLSLAANLTVSGTISVQGNSDQLRILIQSSTMGTSRTLSAATVGTMANVDFQDIAGGGAGSWSLAAITGGSGDCGGNSGITLTTPATQHFTNTNGGSWKTAANWTSRVPLPQDPVVIDTAFGSAKTVTVDMARLGAAIDFTGATWSTSLTLAMATAATSYGSLTLIANLTMTGTGAWTLSGRSAHTINTSGITIERQVTVNSGGGTYTLAANYTAGSTRLLSCSRGTLAASTFVISCGAFTVNSNGTVSFGSATHLLTGTGTAGAVLTLTGNVTAGTSTLKFTDTSNTSVTLSINSRTLYNIWFSRGTSTGSITITGSNTFRDIKDDGTGTHSILVTAGTTQTVTTFNVSGTSGHLITFTSTSTATFALTKAAGTGGRVSVDYLDIGHCVATPPDTFFAGANSTNSQGTSTAGSGWIFKAPQAASKARAFLVGAL